MELPDFLNRNKQKEPAMTTPATKPAKTKRRDAYIARVTISIPLDMANADSLAEAIKAVAAIKDAMPDGTLIEQTASLGKL